MKIRLGRFGSDSRSRDALFPLIAILCLPNQLACQLGDIEIVERSKSFWGMGDRSLCVDGVGDLHVAYGGLCLYYARHDGTRWHYETADSSVGVGLNASLALDGEGRPHISYLDTHRATIKHAYKDSSGWHLQTIDSVGRSPERTAVAVDAALRPHVCYDTGYPAYDLKYAYCDSSGWQTRVVDDVGAHASLALDENGNACISYHSKKAGELRLARRDSLGWNICTIDRRCDKDAHSSIFLDALSQPHISYHYDEGPGYTRDLNYAHEDPSGWHVEGVDVRGEVGEFSSLRLDSVGVPHISYYALDDTEYTWRVSSRGIELMKTEEQRRNLKYARRDQTGWHLESVASEGRTGRYTSLAFDLRGDPCISFFSDDGRDLRVARLGTAGWQVETVDSHGRIGGHVSLKVDAQGRPHLCYHGNEGLVYANRVDTGWRIDTIDPHNGSGWRSSLAITASGHPQVVYVDPLKLKYELRYARMCGDVWCKETIDCQGEVGEWEAGPAAALEIDSQGFPHICYNELDKLDLKYAHRDSSGWHVETVESKGYVGESVSLALKDPAILHSCYFCGEDLKYGRRDAIEWHIESVDSFAHSLSKTARLGLDSSGLPQVIYQVDGTLRIASNDGSEWAIQTLDSLGYASSSIDFALDSSDAPHLVFVDGSLESLNYAFQGSSGWRIVTVDFDNGTTCGDVAIDVDARDKVHIAFAGRTRDLSYLGYVPPAAFSRQSQREVSAK